MSDSSLVVPIAVAIQAAACLVWAGIYHNKVNNLIEESKKREAEIEAECNKRLASEKEAAGVREKDLKAIADDSTKRLTDFRIEFEKKLSDARTESIVGRDAIRLEIQTMFQTSSELRGQRISEFTKDIEKLEGSVKRGFEQVQNTLLALSREAVDNHYRLKTLESDAKARGVRGISERGMPAVTPEKVAGGYSHVNPRGEK